jgi:hypothetical protein
MWPAIRTLYEVANAASTVECVDSKLSQLEQSGDLSNLLSAIDRVELADTCASRM